MMASKGSERRPQTGRLLDFQANFNHRTLTVDFCNNGTPVILNLRGLKTTGLGGKNYLNCLVVEWMFVIDVQSKNHKPVCH